MPIHVFIYLSFVVIPVLTPVGLVARAWWREFAYYANDVLTPPPLGWLTGDWLSVLCSIDKGHPDHRFSFLRRGSSKRRRDPNSAFDSSSVQVRMTRQIIIAVTIVIIQIVASAVVESILTTW